MIGRSGVALLAWILLVIGQNALAQSAPATRPADLAIPALTFDPSGKVKSPADLAELLPADALVYASWTGQDSIHTAYLGSDFKKLWDEPSLAAIRRELARAIDARLAGRIKPGRASAQEARALVAAWEGAQMVFRRPTAVALIPPPGPVQPVEAGFDPMQFLVFLVDVGPGVEDQRRFGEKFWRPAMELLASEIDADLGTCLIEGVRVTQVDIRIEQIKLTWGVSGNVLFFSLREEPVRRLLAVAAGRAAALADSPAYRTMQARWGPGVALTRSYADIGGFGRLVDAIHGEREPDEAVRALRELGLDQARYGGSIRYAGPAMVANRYIAAPAKAGVLFPFAGAPLTEAEQSIVPADALAGVVFRTSPAALYAHLQQQKRLAEAAAPGRAMDLGQMGEVARDAAVVVALSALGDTGGFILFRNPAATLGEWIEGLPPFGRRHVLDRPPAGARPPFDYPGEFAPAVQIVFKWRLRDARNAAALGPAPAAVVGVHLLRSLNASLADLPPIRKHQWEDQLVQYIRDGDGGQVAWAYQGDYLVVSNTIGGVVRVLSGQPGGSAVASDGVRRYAAARPAAVTMFGYVNLPMITRELADAGAGELAAARRVPGFPIRTPLDAAAVARAVSPVVYTASPDAGGVLFTEVGSVSLTGAGMAAYPAVVGLMMGVGSELLGQPQPEAPTTRSQEPEAATTLPDEDDEDWIP